MTEEIDVLKLRAELKRGDFKKIARQTNYSQVYVSYVLNGHKDNVEIINCACELIQQRKESIKQVIEFINAL